MNENQAICLGCGVSKGNGSSHCANCGAEINPAAAICLSCGVAVTKSAGKDAKSKIIAALFGFILGAFGAHNFYLGYTGKAIAQLVLTIIGFLTYCLYIGVFFILGVSIWTLVESVMILTGKIATDANGNLLKNDI